MSWERAARLEELERGPRLVKRAPRQLALFLVDGVVHAVDNRCPHEGYPLVEGLLGDDGVLTCAWHNWKFRLADGACLLGGDDVRRYPTELRGDEVWVDLSDPSPEELRAKVERGLRAAHADRDHGRICREIARLDFGGLDPRLAVQWAVAWTGERLEYGTTHAFAGAADWLALAERWGDDRERRLVCLAEAVDHMAFDALRQPRFPFAPPGEPFDDVAFRAAVEAEEREAAEGMMARALADGLGLDALEGSLTRAALAHYQAFGHSLIYVQKARQLVSRLGPGVDAHLLPALARHLCFTTREDLLPDFRDYVPALAALRRRGLAGTAADPLALEGLAGAGVKAALGWVVERAGDASVTALHDALLAAAAWNLLHFDTRFESAVDGPVSHNVGWLDFTHAITLAGAVREQCARFPDGWGPGLLQVACFVGRNRAFLDADLDEAPWSVGDARAFLDEAVEGLLDHGQRDPIFSVHLLKTTLAVEAALEHASERTARLLVAALHRFLASPIKQKHVRRSARQAIALVGRDFA